MIVCVAVVGPANNPLHLQAFVDEDVALRLYCISHCALDVTDERLALTKREAGPAAFEPYQGLLYMTEDYRVYGYISCTRVKFLITVDDMHEFKEVEMRDIFKKLHAAYADAVSNPFQPYWEQIRSKKFTAIVESICRAPPPPPPARQLVRQQTSPLTGAAIPQQPPPPSTRSSTPAGMY